MSAALGIPDLLKGENVTPRPMRKRSASELLRDLDQPFVMGDGRPCARRFVCLTPDDSPALGKLSAMTEFMRQHPDVLDRFNMWWAGE